MKIRGQAFFDMQTFERVKFGIPDIERVEVQEAEIVTVNEETEEIVGTTKLFMVIVTTTTGKFLSTKPLYDQDYAAYIGHTLAEKCERFHKGS